MKTDYTREELIEICESAFVPEDQWYDRDSCEAQAKLGTAYAFLKAGCKFQIMTEETEPQGMTVCTTDKHTIWLKFWVKNFDHFELGGGPYEHDEIFYLPTKKRLKKVKGGDWY